MSGTGSKRSHEESGNSSGSQTHKTYTHDDLGEYHGIPKISRSESRDSDRRSSPQVPIFTRVSSNDSTHPPPPVTTGLDYINREGARLDDTKDTNELNWKDRKEEQRSWPRTIIHGPEAEKKEFDDETVGENRIDLKEKERKKREGKHREYKETMKEERDVESIVKRESVKEIQTTEPLINIDNNKESDEIQQRRRIVRPRGSPHTNRFKDNNNNNQGKGDVTSSSSISSVIYRVGECMQVLIKLWKEYKSLDGNCEEGPTLEICIPAEHVSATNRQVRGGQLWGTDIYTNDSDVVAVLMHTGYCRPTASPPPVTIQELRATIRVLPPLDCYVSTLRNNVRSRAWGSAIGCSYRIERCVIVKKNGGGSIDLQPCLTQSSTLEPTLAPVAVERTMTTRAAASNALRQQRFVREVTIQFNLCHEPWLKYSISVVADKGLKKPLFASSRLKMGEVLYVETHTRRYELCFNGEKTVKVGGGADNQTLGGGGGGGGDTEMGNGDGENTVIDVFRWSLCKKPLPQKYMRTIGIPLPLEQLEVLEDNVEWDEIHWSQTGVWIGGKEYQLARAHFLSQN